MCNSIGMVLLYESWGFFLLNTNKKVIYDYVKIALL